MEQVASLMPTAPASRPRAGLGLARKQRYDAYIDSPQWRQRREEWDAEQRRRSPARPVCAACGNLWDLRRDDLHHVEYSRLGAERHEDLVPLHRRAHDEVHHLLDRLGLRRRMPLRLANLHVLALARRTPPCDAAVAARRVASEG
ncbi:hypothetical protein GCM10022282_02590 [Agromyces indicus]